MKKFIVAALLLVSVPALSYTVDERQDWQLTQLEKSRKMAVDEIRDLKGAVAASAAMANISDEVGSYSVGVAVNEGAGAFAVGTSLGITDTVRGKFSLSIDTQGGVLFGTGFTFK